MLEKELLIDLKDLLSSIQLASENRLNITERLLTIAEKAARVGGYFREPTLLDHTISLDPKANQTLYNACLGRIDQFESGY